MGNEYTGLDGKLKDKIKGKGIRLVRNDAITQRTAVETSYIN
jgi:hypothetical protein